MNWLQLYEEDSVAVALAELSAGGTLEGQSIRVRSTIPPGHKVALNDLRTGEPVYKYRQVIGWALSPISAGDHVHDHNLGLLGGSAESACSAVRPALSASATDAHFDGYRRSWTNQVGTRNYVLVVPTVNCSGTVARRIAQQVDQLIASSYPELDGAVALLHTGGCAVDTKGQELALLRRTLSGWMRHPNVVGVLLVSLGCEANTVGDLLTAGEMQADGRLALLDIQGSGGTQASIESGVALLRERLPQWARAQREPVPVAALRLALQCGGSDGFSGLSANPALGAAVDQLVAAGGSAILAETPEIHGAEQLLTARARDQDVARKLQHKLQWWQSHAVRHGSKLDHNPSPGNKAGGLTTILEKSLGAVAKGGSTPLCEVLDYAESATASGLVFMDSPGYDPVSVTGQVASGANVVCFTTGRGSVYGCKPVPVLKLASNSALYQRMAGDMDIDCGSVLTGQATVEEMGRSILQTVIATASGTETASERLGLGDDAFVPWTLGGVL